MSKPVCLISGPVFNRSGYGEWTTAIAKSLVRLDKYDVKIIPQRWGDCQRKALKSDFTDKEDIVLYDKIITAPYNGQPDIFMQFTVPNEFARVGKYNIGFTAGIESNIASGEFIEGINRMDLTITISNFSKEVFLNSNITKIFENGEKQELSIKKPIEVCFWGANTNIYKKTDVRDELIDNELNNIPEEFAFLFVGQYTSGLVYYDRKDIGNLIKTFIKAFINTPNKPCLILKTSGVNFSETDRFYTMNLIQAVRSEFSGDIPNVYLLHGELTDVEMNALFNHPKVKCHVSFTHGEGYGHPLLLQTLSGKPLLVSDWSGHKDFLNPKYANLLAGKLVPIPPQARNRFFIEDSKWFNVFYDLAEYNFKNIFKNYNSKNWQENAELLRLENSEKFNLAQMDKRLSEILDIYIPSVVPTYTPFVIPKLVPISRLTE